MAEPLRPDPLPLIARRLGDIAAHVGAEAESATRLVREAADQARAAADLAIAVDAMAAEVATAIRAQQTLLATARQAAADGLPAMAALTAAAARIGAMSTLIDDIAKRSRVLSLNARIEGARAGEAGRGFAVVATEMTGLAHQTREATGDIDRRAGAIGEHVATARTVFAVSANTVERQDAVARDVVDAATRQHRATGEVVRLSEAAVDRVDAAATIIGRVASSAQAVDLLARQLGKFAGREAA